MTAVPPDLLRARLGRREWTITVEVVTPGPGDERARARILALADALRMDERVAALTLTDRTASLEADPIALAPEVARRSGKAPLVHLAGKGRDAAGLAAALRRAEAAGVSSVLLTGGDPLPLDGETERSEAPARAWRSPGARAVQMLRLARDTTPRLARLAVLPALHGRTTGARDDAMAKRDAGASAFVAQVTWDLGEREIVAGWQPHVGAPPARWRGGSRRRPTAPGPRPRRAAPPRICRRPRERAADAGARPRGAGRGGSARRHGGR